MDPDSKSLLEYRGGLCQGSWESEPCSGEDCFILQVHFKSLHCIFTVQPPIQDYLHPSVIYPTGYMTCGSPSFSFKFSFSLCPFITCCLFVEKNCQHAVLPEMVVRCLMYNRSACAHNCSYVWYCNISSLP